MASSLENTKMVKYADIKVSNASIKDSTMPQVAVFAGGTSGIGKLTIKALVGTGNSIRIYLVGRKASEERMRAFIEEMRGLNPKAEIVWVEGEISLLAETKRVCDVIKAKESRVDLLFLTAGYAQFWKLELNSEGHGLAQTLEFYGRMLFAHHLLPALKQANGRVISVAGGGLETTWIDLEDLDLKKHFRSMKTQPLYLTMNSVYMERLADENPDVVFIHTWPGFVDTGNVWRSFDPNSFVGWVVWLTLERLIKLLTYADDEAGDRYLFQSTSAVFGGKGVHWAGKPGRNSYDREASGLYLLNHRCDCTPNAKTMTALRKKARGKIWDHTQMVLGPFL